MGCSIGAGSSPRWWASFFNMPPSGRRFSEATNRSLPGTVSLAVAVLMCTHAMLATGLQFELSVQNVRPKKLGGVLKVGEKLRKLRVHVVAESDNVESDQLCFEIAWDGNCECGLVISCPFIGPIVGSDCCKRETQEIADIKCE